jgi:hypothetical protein
MLARAIYMARRMAGLWPPPDVEDFDDEDFDEDCDETDD